MIKKYLRNTHLWVKITYSDIYLKIRKPKVYKKQTEEFNFYKKLINSIQFKTELIFDIGANVGNKSYLFSKLSNKVLAFEPSSKLCIILKHRFNNSNVQVFNCALGSETTSLDYFEIEGNEGYSSLSQKHIETIVKERNISDLKSLESQKVKVEKVETYIKKFGTPIYIKIDVEGYEYEVIQGLQTVVPLISFESNLPEFCPESIQIINYLSNISSDNYYFNFIFDTSFLLENFVNKNDAIKFLLSTQLRYLEIYAILKN